jgi:hypothetical protein
VSIHKRLWDVARANVTDFAQAFTRHADENEESVGTHVQQETEATPGQRAGKQARHFVDAAEDAWEKAYQKAQERAQEFQQRVVRPGEEGPSERRARWYKTLELPNDAPLDDVRRSYRKLVAQYHPDRFASDPAKYEAATQVMRKITEAYDGLREQLEAAAR